MIFCRGFILLLFINLKLVAQTSITDNDWDFHLNIRDPLHIVFFDDNIYSFSSNGLFSLDINSKAILRNNNSLNLINLKVVETTKNSEYLILGLQDGNIVIYNYEESHIINLGFDEEEVAINSLNIYDETLYVSTSQGLYLISITEKYIIESYRDIGQNGSSLNVLESLIHYDKIYIISTTGVYVLYDNSLNPFDYRSWEKLNFNFDEPFGVVPNNGEIYFYSESIIYDSSLSALYRDEDITIQKVKNINSNIHPHPNPPHPLPVPPRPRPERQRRQHQHANRVPPAPRPRPPDPPHHPDNQRRLPEARPQLQEVPDRERGPFAIRVARRAPVAVLVDLVDPPELDVEVRVREGDRQGLAPVPRVGLPGREARARVRGAEAPEPARLLHVRGAAPACESRRWRNRLPYDRGAAARLYQVRRGAGHRTRGSTKAQKKRTQIKKQVVVVVAAAPVQDRRAGVERAPERRPVRGARPRQRQGKALGLVAQPGGLGLGVVLAQHLLPRPRVVQVEVDGVALRAQRRVDRPIQELQIRLGRLEVGLAVALQALRRGRCVF